MPTPVESPELHIDETAKPPIETNACTRRHWMPFGAEIVDAGAVRFRLWAPAIKQVAIAFEDGQGEFPLLRANDGWHELVTPQAYGGTRYRFVLPDGTRVPDPASRYQPEDAHGPSEVVDPVSYVWADSEWHGRPWSQAVLYELHIGTFTEEGTFRAAIDKLDHLAALGVTALQIMPVADFSGRFNWGYDGVLLYAPDSCYGRPEDLKALVDAAHNRGIMVLLDVVYNHFGPDGNYLPLYAPQTFTERHKTPWGDAINYDSDASHQVRQFVIHNALYWLEEFNLDGLRFDAVHQIKDDSTEHLLDEIARRVRAKDLGKPIHLVLENEKNEAFRLQRDGHGQPKGFTAQWNDDIHHVLHTAATSENHAYYKDFVEDSEKLGRALAEGFAFQGQRMESLGCDRGEPSAHLPPTAFVAFMQNHDQVGNRAFGDRISSITTPEAVHAIAAVYLLLPQTPMLFMGEEWGTRRPFPFFCDFPGELGQLVREGRREEFANLPEFQDAGQRAQIPDPGADATFFSGKLDWQEREKAEHAQWLDWYKRILQVRREQIEPLIDSIGGNAGQFRVLGPNAVLVRWRADHDLQLTLHANLSDNPLADAHTMDGRTLWQEGLWPNKDQLGPWSLRWSLQNEKQS
jgi:malto-oligosyltrehalose trehalohydrolase